MTNKLSKPIKPENDDCCGGGCYPCVWDTYFDALYLWEEQEEKTLADMANPSVDKVEID